MSDEPLTYDADVGPDPEEWASSDEGERIEAVREYHRRLREPHPAPSSWMAHAAIHSVVEHQIALGEETPVKATLERLLQGGLKRYDAIHAIGSVLAEHLWMIMRDDVATPPDPNEAYYAALESLDAESWRAKARTGDEPIEVDLFEETLEASEDEAFEDEVFEDEDFEDHEDEVFEKALRDFEREEGARESSAARRERRRKRKKKRRR